MPKQMHASIAVDLHVDEFVEAKEKLDFKPLWDAFLTGLTAAGVKHTAKLETIETRAKPATNGARRTRRTAAQIAADKAAHGAAGTELGV
jgi:hypothetical protein